MTEIFRKTVAAVAADPSEDAVWDAYNLLLTSHDVDRVRKLLVRYDLFKKTIDVPGDIVECGVFKGTGLLTFAKFLAIHCPGSIKKVVGLDFFGDMRDRVIESLPRQDKVAMADLFAASGVSAISSDVLIVKGDRILPGRVVLVDGDIAETAPSYVNASPGFKISLLHLDLDAAAPTLAALEAFWPRLSRGGVVIFDEYAIDKWSESQAVDAFFADKDVEIKTLPYGRTPTAYVVKM